MSHAIRISLILLLGAGLGLAIRTLRQGQGSQGPGKNETVYTDQGYDPDAPIDLKSIQNDTPTVLPEDAEWLSEFTLTERSGKTVSSKSLLGTPYIVSFFFTRCPSICVNQNKKILELQNQFADSEVKFLAISCDPEFDRPEILREYAARFGADPEQWLFLTGDLTYIRRIGAEIFKQHVARENHTERFALVDRAGEIQGFYSWSQDVQFEKLKAAITSLTQQDAS